MAQFGDPNLRAAAQQVLQRWLAAGYRRRLESGFAVLQAPGPSRGGIRSVITIYADGQVLVPFNAYEGTQSGIPIPALTTAEFRAQANTLFGFDGTEKVARTAAGWLAPERTEPLLEFCFNVAEAYAADLE